MASIKRNLFFNILLTTSQVVSALIILPYVSRVMGPFALGRVSFVDSATQYFIICASLGIPIYGIREIAKVKNDKRQLMATFSELLLIQILATAILFSVYLLLVLFAGKFRAERDLFNLGLLQVMLSAFVTDWLYQGMENYVIVSIRAFVIRTFSVVCILLFVKSSADTYLYYAIWTSSIVINVLMSALPYLKYLHFRDLNLTRHIKPVFTFFSTKVVTSIYVILLSFFVGYMQDKSYVAYFTSAYKICTVSLTFILAFSTVLIPKLSDYYHNNMIEEGNRLLAKNFNVMINYSMPLVFVLIFFADALINIMLGRQFLPAQADLMLMAPLIIVMSISNIFSMNVLTPLGKERLFLRATFIGMLVNLLIVFFLISYLKDLGAAIALLITETVVCLLVAYYSRAHVKDVIINYRVAILNLFNCLLSFGLVRYLIKFVFIIRVAYLNFAIELAICGIIYLFIELFVIKDPFYMELATNIKSKIPGLKHT